MKSPLHIYSIMPLGSITRSAEREYAAAIMVCYLCDQSPVTWVDKNKIDETMQNATIWLINALKNKGIQSEYMMQAREYVGTIAFCSSTFTSEMHTALKTALINLTSQEAAAKFSPKWESFLQ